MSSAAQQAHIEHPIDLIEGLAASRSGKPFNQVNRVFNMCLLCS